jgi:hypothetical protein
VRASHSKKTKGGEKMEGKLEKEIDELFNKIQSDVEKLGKKLRRLEKPNAPKEISGETAKIFAPLRLLSAAVNDTTEKINKTVKPEKKDSYRRWVWLIVYHYLFEQTLPSGLKERAIRAVQSSLMEEKTVNYIY